jgi:hypothetical protein
LTAVVVPARRRRQLQQPARRIIGVDRTREACATGDGWMPIGSRRMHRAARRASSALPARRVHPAKIRDRHDQRARHEEDATAMRPRAAGTPIATPAPIACRLDPHAPADGTFVHSDGSRDI